MDGPLLLSRFFQHETGPALRTGLGNGFVPERKLTFRILVTPIKDFSFTRLFFDQLALAIRFGAGYAQTFSFDVFALRIVTAGRKLSVAPVFDDKIFSALRAFLVSGNVRNGNLAGSRAGQPLGGLAFRIARASQKLAKSSPLQGHGLTAVLTDLFDLLYLNASFGGRGSAVGASNLASVFTFGIA